MPSTARPAFVLHQPGLISPLASVPPSGVSPSLMRHAYGVDQVAFGSVLSDGTGQTIAIIDAFDQPSLAGDLAAFDRQFGLADPPSLTKINETGGTTLPRPDFRGGWGVETSLDVEWAHAIAPQAAILLVEANSAATSDLFTAVDTARNYPGVSVVSMSWGGDETAADSAADAHFTTPTGHNGVTFVAASGDRGAYSATGSSTATVLYPAASPNVLSVGGTELLTGPDGSYISETSWGNGTDSNRAGGSGGGISRYVLQPDYQQGVVTQSQTFRTVPDVAIDADPAGVPVYDSYDQVGATPWLHVGGTSLVAPLWAGIIALADQGRALDGLGTLDGRHDTLPDLYALPAGDFHDITTGSNGYAAGPGYDLATGRGTPVVDRLVHDLASATPAPAPSAIAPSTLMAPTLVSVTEISYIPLGFANWSAIQPAIAQVPASAGQLAHVSVVNFGTTVYTGPLNVSNTINRIRADNGPITTDDGKVFTNSSHQLPPGGTYYEFNVAPRNGTDHTFTFASPGPMRLVLNTNGSLYFTGDHYSTFVAVYVHGQGTPTIGSFTINPSTVMSGGSTTLTASNVTETGGTIQGVSFYLSGSLVGNGTRSGNNWSLSVSTGGFLAGTYTYTAIATDTNGNQSAPATATLTVTRGTPTIGSFTINPNSVQAGTPVTFTAGNVTEAGGTIVDVSFYLSGTLIGSGSQSGNNWSLPVATDGYAPGTYTFTAIATDDAGNTSAPASATLTVTSAGVPMIGSFTIDPSTVQAGTPVTLTAGNVTDTGGTVIDVSFYLAGALVGSGSQSGNNWSLAVATDSFTPGTYTFMAIATDDVGNQSTPAPATLTVTGTGIPIIGSFTVDPSRVQPGTPVTLTAGNVTDTGGTVIDVSFYLAGTLLGSGTQSGNDWSMALATDGFTAGTYTLSAIATDDAGNQSATVTATLTVTNTTYSGVLLGWDVNGLTNFGPQGFGATQVASGVSNSLGLTRGSGVATSQTAAANAWGGNNWAATSTAGINGNEFVTFGLTVAGGDSASLSSIDLYYRRSSSGPSSGYWQYELNGGAWVTIGDFPNQFSSTSSSGAAMNELNLTGLSDLQHMAGGTVVVFRLVPYAASSSGGTWYVYDQAGNDLVINGAIQGTGGSPVASSRHHGGAASLAIAGSSCTPVVEAIGESTALASPPAADTRPIPVLPTIPLVYGQPADFAQPHVLLWNLGDDSLTLALLDQAMEVIALGFPVT